MHPDDLRLATRQELSRAEQVVRPSPLQDQIRGYERNQREHPQREHDGPPLRLGWRTRLNVYGTRRTVRMWERDGQPPIGPAFVPNLQGVEVAVVPANAVTGAEKERASGEDDETDDKSDAATAHEN